MAPFEPHDGHEHGTTGRDVTLILLVMIMLGCVVATFDPPPPPDVEFDAPAIVEVAP